jgi:predicted N-acyltransferase
MTYDSKGIKIKTIRGDSDAATVDLFRQMFQIYSTTVEKMWGQKYLSETFFEMLAEVCNVTN